MKNVLLILNENLVAENVVETAIKIARINHAAIRLFFTNPQLPFTAGDDNSIKNKELVISMCTGAAVEVAIINENETLLSQVLQQDASINLVIAESPLAANAPGIPNQLASAKCPVYLISADSDKIENIILSYDGSFSSINAIKEYAKLFPETLSLPTHFVHIDSDDNDEFVRQKNIESWLPQPFNNAQYKLMKDGMGTEFLKFIASIPDCLAVVGNSWKNRSNHFVY